MRMVWGQRFRVELFGSSHGPEVGVEVSGLPRGLPLSLEEIQRELNRRSPVGRRWATKRQEPDRLIVDRGYADGAATGEPFRAHVANLDVRRGPYDAQREVPRPGHADYPARVRYGPEADLSGGGIFSGRMTVGLVIAGALARRLLRPLGFQAAAFARSIGGVEANVPADLPLEELARRAAEHETGCPDPVAREAMEAAIAEARRAGDSVGGVIEVRAEGLPVGLGEPFFDSIESVLAHLAFSVPAVKAIEFGAGFAAARLRGSQHNDAFAVAGDRIVTATNYSGGILGGLATGMPLVFRAAVKPTASIARPQRSVRLDTRTPVELVVRGRHDPCIVPRAVPVLEAITAVGLAELALEGGFVG